MQLKEIKGIGEKTSLLFHKLSVFSVEELIQFYPRAYESFEPPVKVAEIIEKKENSVVAIEGIVLKSPDVVYLNRKSIISCIVKDAAGAHIKMTWYNMDFLKKMLRMGLHAVFRGRVVRKKGMLICEQPEIHTVAEYARLMNTMQPVYPLTKGLSNKIVMKAVQNAFAYLIDEQEFLPEWICKEYNLQEHNPAIKKLHFPSNRQELQMARRRLIFEEFFLFVLTVRRLKEDNALQPNDYKIPHHQETQRMLEKLPYVLTEAQKRTWEDIKGNMAGNRLMNRLVQGDVGSGKTIIAILALMNTVYAGYQAAMMVPTEVLAKQHYQSVTQLFETYEIKIETVLLIGSMTAREKKEVYHKIKTGEAGIIIGTHALIQDKVEYDNLALVITDEQHRFGVRQRESLSDKGNHPHILVMSATPIPRTLAIILYGDLDISVIDEMPSDRLSIKNCVVDENYRPKAYQFIGKQVAEGRQVYVICPMVEESENVEAENVVEYSETLKEKLPVMVSEDGCFEKITVEYLHGKMKPAEKNEIMERFSQGGTNVLVSTTVIEVGINVPNATVIMIENAERFGLAQLHQLRGRVGRGKYQSYCIFISNSKSKNTQERLEILNKTNDGFKIAEEDMKLRGAGEILGIRQSGEMVFQIGDIYGDSDLLQIAAEAAKRLLGQDHDLTDPINSLLHQKMLQYSSKIIDKINI